MLLLFLLLLSGMVYFAVESLEPEEPILDLMVVVVLGFFTLALAWVVVGARWARRADPMG